MKVTGRDRITRSQTFGVLALGLWVLFIGPAHADSLYADFHHHSSNLLFNPTDFSVTTGGQVVFTLNSDGTIAASLTSDIGLGLGILGFGFDSVAALLESGFSHAASVGGWDSTFYGNFNSGWDAAAPGFYSYTWTIGNPGDFGSVFDAVGGGNSSYDFLLLLKNNNLTTGVWAADAIAGTPPVVPRPGVGVVPLPASLPLFASGLAGLGWLARRKPKQVQSA